MQGGTISRRTALAAGAAMVFTLAPAAQASNGSLIITGAWTRPASKGQTGAGYLSITNKGRAADRLIAASTEASGRVSLHQSTMVGSVATMRPLDAVTIPAGATVNFRPGGLHLMLAELKRPLKIGDRVAVTLIFAKAGRRSAEFWVRDGPPARAMPGMTM